MLTDEQKKVAAQAFDDIDDRGAGWLPNSRVILLELAQLTGLNPTQREIDQHWNKELGDTITKDQFLELVSLLDWKEHDELKLQLRSDFEMFDTEGIGSIEPGDLVHVLTKEGRNRLDEKEATEAVQTFERDANGHINIERLIELLVSPRPHIKITRQTVGMT